MTTPTGPRSRAATSHVVRARPPRGTSAAVEIVTAPDRLSAYLEDAAHVPGGQARALALPVDERQVAEALRSSQGGVLVVGSQSSLTGGATPRGELVLSTARLRALDDLPDGRLRAGAGVTIAEIDDRLRRRRAIYPPAPTWTGATIGGTIATNAAGAATFKYGTTRSWVDALTVVLASGDVLDLQRGRTIAHPDGYFDVELAAGAVRVPVPSYRMPLTPKASAGYFAAAGMDLVDLFVGAEGTLGIVTDATLRVQAAGMGACLAFLTLSDRGSALALVHRLREEAQRTWRSGSTDGLDVAAIEHMDGRSLALLREDGVDRRLGLALDPGAAAGLLLSIDVRRDPQAAVQQLAEVVHPWLPGEAAIVAMPGDAAAARRLVALREAVPLAVNQRVGRVRQQVDARVEKTAADVIVPFERTAELFEAIDAEARRRDLDVAVWGHVSDGNLHPNVIPRSFADVDAGREAVLAWGREAIRLGGSPMAEHGVGRSRIKQQLMEALYGREGVEQMKAVKRALDPEWKLAPGVLFPPDAGWHAALHRRT